MTTWRDVRERYKAEDRYYVYYDDPEGFWHTFDSRLVAWTFRLPYIGVLPRIVLALLGSNRREPYPIGNSPVFTTMYGEDSAGWYRWMRWHIRNPWEDFKRYYLGFGHAVEQGSVEEIVLFSNGELDSRDFWKVSLWKAHFPYLPFPLVFPYYKIVKGSNRFLFGWKSRGVLGFTLDLS